VPRDGSGEGLRLVLPCAMLGPNRPFSDEPTLDSVAQALADVWLRPNCVRRLEELGAPLGPTAGHSRGPLLEGGLEHRLLADGFVAEPGESLPERPQPRGGGGAAAKPAPAQRPSPPPKLKTWIEIQLVDASGRPRAGEPYVLLLSDGKTQEGTLDATGSVRVSGIDPGACRITFPKCA